MITTELAVGITVIGTVIAFLISLAIAEHRARRRQSRAIAWRVPTPAPPRRDMAPTRPVTAPVVVKDVRINAYGELETLAWDRTDSAGPGKRLRTNQFGELIE